MTTSLRVVTEDSISHAISKASNWGYKSWSNKCCTGCEGRTKCSGGHEEQPSLDCFKHPFFLISVKLSFICHAWTDFMGLTAFHKKKKGTMNK